MPPLRYTVRRRNWRRVADSWHRLPGSDRVASFDSPDEAETERDRLEAEARAAINPFACGACFADRSHLDEGRFRDWLLDAGLEPPEGGNWLAWWEELPESAEGVVWQALDRVRFYDIVAAAEKPVVYVVVEIPWVYADYEFVAETAGCVPHRVFRSRAQAEQYCRENPNEFYSSPFNINPRRNFQIDPLGLREPPDPLPWHEPSEADPAPLWEIVEMEVDE